MTRENVLRFRIKWLLIGFVVGLILSGLTAFPLEWELKTAAKALGATSATTLDNTTGLLHWIIRVRDGLVDTYAKYPFVAYGTDWLAFAHIVIGIAFIGPLRNPTRNLWVIEWAMIACVLVIPLALICGPIRGIPFYWRLIDCSFGVVGIVPLWIARSYILELGRLTGKA